MNARKGYLNIVGVISFQSPEPAELKFLIRKVLEQRADSFGIIRTLGTKITKML